MKFIKAKIDKWTSKEITKTINLTLEGSNDHLANLRKLKTEFTHIPWTILLPSR